MNIEFKPERPEAVIVEDIFVSGVKIGTVEPSNRPSELNWYHACISIGGYFSLLQGFADTKEEAIEKALTDAVINANRIIAEVEKIRQMISEAEAAA